MHISLTASLALSPDEAIKCMTSREFQQEKAEAVGALRFDMDLMLGVAPTVITRRTLATGNLPEFIKPMLNPTMTVTEVEHWGPRGKDGERSGVFTIDVDGAPVTLRGSVTLAPTEDGCSLTFSGDLKSSVPLFRNKIEESAAGSVEDTIRSEFDLLRQRAEAPTAGTALAS